jgi:trigger factor
MKVTVEDQSSVKKVLHIEIPAEDVTRELDRAYRDLKRNAKVKGFRPGKTPRSVLERLYKKDVNADVSSRLIQESFIEAIKEQDLSIVGQPQLDPPELNANQAYQYEATVEIKPDIEDVDFKGLNLNKTQYEVSDGETEAQLSMLQKRLARQEKIETARPLQEGDFALIDYEGFKDGEAFEETARTENFTLKIGDGHIHKDFDQQLVGMNPGETKEITVNFPDDYFNAKLATLRIDFNVTLNEIRQEVLPEIDDEMAKSLGKFETLDELKSAIIKNLTEGYEKRTEQELNEQIFQHLIEKTDFELPESLVNYELEGILQELERSLANQYQTMEDAGLSRDELSAKYHDTAEKQVRRQLIMAKIIEQEGLTLEDGELDEGFQTMAQAFNQPVDGIKSYYDQFPDKLDLFKHSLLEKKAMKLIIESSAITEIAPDDNEKNQDKSDS